MRVRVHTHQAAEAFERARYSHMGIDLDKDAFCGVNVYLEPACLVKWGVKEGQQTLYGVK